MIGFVPESPLHYARKGDTERAKSSMRQLYGGVANYDVEYEYRVIEHGIEVEKALILASQESSFLDIFRGTNWRRTLAGAVGICTQWAAGAPIVFSYSTVSRSKDVLLMKYADGWAIVLFRSCRHEGPILGYHHYLRPTHRLDLVFVGSLRVCRPPTSPYWWMCPYVPLQCRTGNIRDLRN